jgi:hypothetical protein
MMRRQARSSRQSRGVENSMILEAVPVSSPEVKPAVRRPWSTVGSAEDY